MAVADLTRLTDVGVEDMEKQATALRSIDGEATEVDAAGAVSMFPPSFGSRT